MKPMRLVNAAAVALSTMGILCQPVVAAGPQAPVQTKKAAVVVEDIALGVNGSLTGRVVDAQGQAIDGASVSVVQANKEVAKTVANAAGEFTLQNLKGGTYQINAGQASGIYRLWANNSAPKNAQDGVLMVAGQNVVRGQFGGVDPTLVLLTGGVAAGVVMGAINLDRTNKIKSELDKVPKSN